MRRSNQLWYCIMGGALCYSCRALYYYQMYLPDKDCSTKHADDWNIRSVVQDLVALDEKIVDVIERDSCHLKVLKNNTFNFDVDVFVAVNTMMTRETDGAGSQDAHILCRLKVPEIVRPDTSEEGSTSKLDQGKESLHESMFRRLLEGISIKEKVNSIRFNRNSSKEAKSIVLLVVDGEVWLEGFSWTLAGSRRIRFEGNVPAEAVLPKRVNDISTRGKVVLIKASGGRRRVHVLGSWRALCSNTTDASPR